MCQTFHTVKALVAFWTTARLWEVNEKHVRQQRIRLENMTGLCFTFQNAETKLSAVPKQDNEKGKARWKCNGDSKCDYIDFSHYWVALPELKH